MLDKELILEGQSLLDTKLFGPPSFNKWRAKVIKWMDHEIPNSDAVQKARSIPKAEKPSNPQSGRGLRSSDIKNVSKLVNLINVASKEKEKPVKSMNWDRIFNRLYEIINTQGLTYYSGVRFLKTVRKVDPYFSNYNVYISERKRSKKSTIRKDYYRDIFMGFCDEIKGRFIIIALEEIGHHMPDKASAIRDELLGNSPVPQPNVSQLDWNDRLQEYITEIDARILLEKYEGAITLSYTCVEGFLKSFLERKVPAYNGSTEIIAASKAVKGHLKETLANFPDEAISMVTHICHTIDKTRNRFSESHFDSKANRWLAILMRDLMNTLIRLLLHFDITLKAKIDC